MHRRVAYMRLDAAKKNGNVWHSDRCLSQARCHSENVAAIGAINIIPLVVTRVKRFVCRAPPVDQRRGLPNFSSSNSPISKPAAPAMKEVTLCEPRRHRWIVFLQKGYKVKTF